jgi:NTE family protein
MELPVHPGTTAFVLQGGGSLAASQVGMLRALFEVGLAPDLMIGSSAGAVNAVAFASDPSAAGLDRLEALWLALRRRDVAPLSLRTFAGAVTGRTAGIVSGAALCRMLQRNIEAATLSDTVIPVHVVATELESGKPVVLSEGDPVTALRASCAFPGLYAPVTVGGRRLIDGGVSADAPILQAESLGATLTYLLPAAGSESGQGMPRGPIPFALRAMGQVLDASVRRDVELAGCPVRVLPAPSAPVVNPVNFRETRRLIDTSYQLAAEWLARHRLTAVSATA